MVSVICIKHALSSPACNSVECWVGLVCRWPVVTRRIARPCNTPSGSMGQNLQASAAKSGCQAPGQAGDRTERSAPSYAVASVFGVQDCVQCFPGTPRYYVSCLRQQTHGDQGRVQHKASTRPSSSGPEEPAQTISGLTTL